LTFGGENAEAYFSADGKRLSFQSTRDGHQCDQIYSMNIDGSDVRMVSNGDGRTTCAYYLPNGKRILYSSTHQAAKECPPRPDFSKGYVWAVYPSFDIFTAKPDGSDLKQLTNTPGYDAETTISKSGKLVFTSMRDGDLDIYTMDADGKNVRRLTNELGYDGGPFWSYDGKQIVYRAHHPQSAKDKSDYLDLLKQNLIRPSTLEIWVMNADGSNKRQVTNNGKANFAPYFLPDGKRIIFASNVADAKGRDFDLYVINVDGTGLERITYNDTFDGFPMFSPDGRRLVFASNRNAQSRGDTNLFIADWVESDGILAGLILDPMGARVPGASIEAQSKDFRKTVLSGQVGNYRMELPPGEYSVTVSTAVFLPGRRQHIRISSNGATNVDWTLKVKDGDGGKLVVTPARH
jgi:Tol biopolymer transport system component